MAQGCVKQLQYLDRNVYVDEEHRGFTLSFCKEQNECQTKEMHEQDLFGLKIKCFKSLLVCKLVLKQRLVRMSMLDHNNSR